jgi:hypothetical protein
MRVSGAAARSEAESMIEESRHRKDDVTALQSELKSLWTTHRNLMDQFNVKYPKINDSSASLILTRELEKVRAVDDRISAEDQRWERAVEGMAVDGICNFES